MNKVNFKKNIKNVIFFASRQKNISILVIVTIFTSFLELLSISMAIPLVMVVIEDDISRYQYLSNFFLFFEVTSQKDRVIISLVIFIIVFTCRSLFLIIAEYFKLNFLYKLSIKVNENIHKILLTQPWFFYFKNNTAALIQRNYTETSLVIGNLFTAILQIVVDLLFLIMAAILFFKIEPLGSSVIFIFFILLASIYFLVIKKSLGNWGQTRMVMEKKVIQSLIENFNMIREIKYSYNKLSFFISKFLDIFKKLGTVGVKEQIFYTITRIFFELTTVLVFCLIIFYFYLYVSDKNYTLFILGIFSIAAFRILPLINRTLNGFQKLKFYLPAINNLSESLELFSSIEKIATPKDQKFILFEKAIELKNLSFNYENNKQILNNINLKIFKNEIIGIQGESGSGKTTFVDLLSGLYMPTNGSILVDNEDIKNNLYDWRMKIAYVPQNITLFNSTIEENIAIGETHDEIDQLQLDKSIKDSQLNNWINSLTEKNLTIISESGLNISGGQKQRIGVARALYQNKQILILDESTSALDIKTANLFIEFVFSLRGKKTIIIISHMMEVLSKCDRVLELKNNSIYEKI